MISEHQSNNIHMFSDLIHKYMNISINFRSVVYVSACTNGKVGLLILLSFTLTALTAPCASPVWLAVAIFIPTHVPF